MTFLRLLLPILFLLTLFPSSGQTEVVGYAEFSELPKRQQITWLLSHYQNEYQVSPRESLVVLDWDNTLTTHNGSDEARSGVDELLSVFEKSNRSEPLAKILIQTNRLKGYPLSDIEEAFMQDGLEYIWQDTHAMLEQLLRSMPEVLWQSFPSPYSSMSRCQEILSLYSESTDSTFFLSDYVFFSGSRTVESNKGEGLSRLLEIHTNNHSVTDSGAKPRLVFVLDDLKRHLFSISEWFRERPEKVVLIHVFHPQSYGLKEDNQFEADLRQYPIPEIPGYEIPLYTPNFIYQALMSGFYSAFY